MGARAEDMRQEWRYCIWSQLTEGKGMSITAII